MMCTRAFLYGLKKTLNLYLTYFENAISLASIQTNKKALIPLGIRAFPNFNFLEKRCVQGLEPVTPCVTGMYSNQLN